jgi:hypothetical protein
MNQKTKGCTKCQEELPATTEFFHKNKSKKDGLCSKCKECKKQYNKQYYQDHKEEFKEKNQQYYKNKIANNCWNWQNRLEHQRNIRKALDIPPNIYPNIKRTCFKCKRTFPATLEYFYKCKRSPLGMNYNCKECFRERKRRQYKLTHSFPNFKDVVEGKSTVPITKEAVLDIIFEVE